METKKIKFMFGNNEKYDYFIIDSKDNAIEVELDKESLAYKIAGAGIIKMSRFANLPFGNSDFVIEKRDKNGNFKGLTLATYDEIDEY